MRRARWSQFEVQRLQELVQQQAQLSPFNIDWLTVARAIASKSPAQCRVRYHNKTKFEKDAPGGARCEWKQGDGLIVIQMAQETAKNWQLIARTLNRTASQVKNHYYFMMRGVNKMVRSE
ncbi:Myb-like DNA-binding domain-containing protein [Spironucleus salmonicida]|uniref:Myb-like DNA-binding domain-containing protein n=1 Tax=Spironucleus salmonicida TaxID=348837 RepID=V6M0D7_9EUKA|nr:Myb-like DNA-binding domain-containing protein [Spironucleus salmonicida]|eukprot:EST49506.1 Myb-like DNA-binding domain-containing protein [Spironucleus salmonicida]